jgi:hypothetical protein
MIFFAVLGITMLFPRLSSIAYSYDISDFILKVNPGASASLIPDDFLKTGKDDEKGFAYEGYIDGYKIICRTKSGRIRSVHAQKEFNTADYSAEHTYYNILGSVLARLMKKYNGTLVTEKGRGENTDRMPHDFGEYCYFTTLRGEGKTIKTKDFNLGFWFDLGSWKRCDNDKYNSSNPGRVIIEFK